MNQRNQRNDRIGRLDAIRKDNRGGLRVPATPTRTGVFIYRNQDGSMRRELRHPDEVFNEDSLASLAGVPVTVQHPREAVTSANWKALSVGHVGDTARRDGIFVTTDVCVTEGSAVRRVENKELVELSLGYECEFDPTPGEYEGERYDGVQRNIVYNHLALLQVGQARGGSEVRLRLDSDEGCLVTDLVQDNLSSMELEQLKAELAAAKVSDAASKARCDALEAEAKSLRARTDAAEAAAKPEVVDAKVKVALKLREDARSVQGDEKLPEGDEAIMVAVITKRDPSFKKDSLTYPLVARFDAELALHTQSALGAVNAAQTSAVVEVKADAKDEDPVEKAKAAWAAKNKDLYKKDGI